MEDTRERNFAQVNPEIPPPMIATEVCTELADIVVHAVARMATMNTRADSQFIQELLWVVDESSRKICGNDLVNWPPWKRWEREGQGESWEKKGCGRLARLHARWRIEGGEKC